MNSACFTWGHFFLYMWKNLQANYLVGPARWMRLPLLHHTLRCICLVWALNKNRSNILWPIIGDFNTQQMQIGANDHNQIAMVLHNYISDSYTSIQARSAQCIDLPYSTGDCSIVLALYTNSMQAGIRTRFRHHTPICPIHIGRGLSKREQRNNSYSRWASCGKSKRLPNPVQRHTKAIGKHVWFSLQKWLYYMMLLFPNS